MTTPLIMLVLLAGPYLAVRSVSVVTREQIDARPAAALGLALMFVYTGIGHFAQTREMVAMLPPWVPARVAAVYLTGVLEFALAAGFLLPRTRRISGWVAAAMLVLFFPVNVYAAIARVPMGGHAWGPAYLLIRAPLQLIVLLWIWRFTIRRRDEAQQLGG